MGDVFRFVPVAEHPQGDRKNLLLMCEHQLIEGRRVGLRPLADSDAEALFDAVSSSREGLKRRLRWVPAVGGAEDESRFIADAAARAAARTAVVWGIFENRTGRLAGVISLVGMEDAERAQGRFGHLTDDQISAIADQVEYRYAALKDLCGAPKRL